MGHDAIHRPQLLHDLADRLAELRHTGLEPRRATVGRGIHGNDAEPRCEQRLDEGTEVAR